MNLHHFVARLAASTMLAACANAADAPKSAGHYERVTVHAPTLGGNLDGDAIDRPVSVYLPPDYSKDPQRRYPVIYLLHGFTDSDSKWFGLEGPHFVNVQRAFDAAYVAGAAKFIIVMPNAFTRFQGSMYGNSVATGDWETFISRDLVAYVDTHYRTLATPASRGLAGHSMGGYGTLRIGMKAPGVFSALYIMNPCCLQPPDAQAAAMFEPAGKIKSDADVAAADFPTKAALASAAAWSPNPGKPPLFIDLLVQDGHMVPSVVARWTANAPNVMLHQYLPALRSYSAIGLEAGAQDPVSVDAARELHELLSGYSIAHDYASYDGDHVNRIQQRITANLVPFFAAHLKGASQ